jgi:nitroreductase/NAD-dependent dihydropyrimidine dehydrogenase PreA subunit
LFQEEAMKIAGIDGSLCTGCTACVEECGANLFVLEQGPDGGRARIVHRDLCGWCTACGHCYAVCPVGAILWDPPQPLSTLGGRERPQELCSYDALLLFLQTKRSVRRYSHRTVPRSEIEAVLEAMRCAPSGHNLQANRYLVITDPELQAAISDQTIRGFKRFRGIVRLRKLLRPFLSPKQYEVLDSPGLLEGIDDMIRRREQGEDPILFGAPVVILVYYPDLGSLSLLDPTIAFTYGMLAAHSLGLATCWIGFAIQSLFKSRPMRDLLGIPGDMLIAGVMTMGYPVPSYHRIPPRNQLSVRWLNRAGEESDESR